MACTSMLFVFSGFRDTVLVSQIEAEGGRVATSLVKNATHLLVKADGKPSTKIAEAEARGMTVLDLDEFIQEHEFTLKPKAERKPKAEKPKAEQKQKPKASSYQADLQLLATVTHTIATKQNKEVALDALYKLAVKFEAEKPKVEQQAKASQASQASQSSQASKEVLQTKCCSYHICNCEQG